MDLLERVLRENRRSVATDRLYEWLGVVSDPDLALAKWQTASVRFDLEWNSDVLKALIAHGVETCLRRGVECTGLVNRRLFGARPRGYGPSGDGAAAEEGKAGSFYLRELFDCVMDGVRADGLTVDAARTGLAPDEALVNQFDEMVERRARVETRTERGTAPESEHTESPEDTAEQRTWQADIEAQAPALRAGRGAQQLLHRAAEAYLGIQENSAAKTPRERLGDFVGSRIDLIDLLLAGMEGTIAREDLRAATTWCGCSTGTASIGSCCPSSPDCTVWSSRAGSRPAT